MDANPSTPNPGEAKRKSSDEPPKYRLTEPSYINEMFYDQVQVDQGKAVIFFDGVPGPHMLPLNDAAKAMVAKHKPVKIDALDALTSLQPPKPKE